MRKVVKKWKTWRRCSYCLGLMGVGFLVMVGSVQWFFPFAIPFAIREAQSRWELRRQGVVSQVISGVHVYIKDQCQQNRAENRADEECTCVALIHGLADQALTWKKILLWPEVEWRRLGLDQRLKLVAVDLPGSGKTPPPPDDSGYRVRNQARLLRSVFAATCTKWTIVGQSMGGWIAAWIGLDWPEGVQHLILLDSAGLSASIPGGPKDVPSAFVEPTIASLKEFQRKAYFRPRPVSDGEWQWIITQMKLFPIQKILAAQTEEDVLNGRLASLTRPTLLIWGKEDRILPLSVGQWMRSLISGVLWREIPECGHNPQKECPLPVIQSIIDMTHYGVM